VKVPRGLRNRNEIDSPRRPRRAQTPRSTSLARSREDGPVAASDPWPRYLIVGLLLVVLAGLALSVRILKQYERAVIFRLGRVKGGARGPGLIPFAPLVNRVHRVSLRIITMPIQSQGIITRDNFSVDVSAVAYYRISDPIRSVVAIENVSDAINQIAQTTLRAVVGRYTLDETLSETTRSTRTSARSSMSRPRSGASR
jgi:regulator of protease activity HflC (stomatin/prohibitin superfamily)